ncbi:MAG: 50S ribosomal protein L29 [Acidimicrobiia bacterium]|jgi:large subunit ribosomal protein L29|nr:50S ribosomal protein L29 [Acidimicrobiia bacterium]
MARTSPLSDLGDAELFEKLAEAKQEIFNLRFQHVTGQLDNHAALSAARKHVARVLTEIRMREITAAEALAASEESN